MKVFFAGYVTDSEIHIVKEAQNLLGSYLEFKNKDYIDFHKSRNLVGRTLFLDSGAFTAFTQKKVINIDDYANFIKKNQSIISTYANLDVIGDAKKTMLNQVYLESLGLKPLPTFHFKSDLQELENLCQKYDYIALGGLVPLSMDVPILRNWLRKCFKITMKYKTKVHGFGIGAFWAWKEFPFYSVDATSWLIGSKYRRLIEFDYKTGTIKTYGKEKGSLLEKYRCHKQSYKDLNRQNVIEYIKAADFVTRLWAKRGYVFNN